ALGKRQQNRPQVCSCLVGCPVCLKHVVAACRQAYNVRLERQRRLDLRRQDVARRRAPLRQIGILHRTQRFSEAIRPTPRFYPFYRIAYARREAVAKCYKMLPTHLPFSLSERKIAKVAV